MMRPTRTHRLHELVGRVRPLRPVARTALIGLVAVVAGCASTTSSNATGANTVEGGVKIPGAATSATVTSTTVHVTLSDTNGLAGPMTLTVSPATAPAGDVTFVVKNTGTIDHEAVVLKTNTPFDKLPITDADDPPVPVTHGANKVSEDHQHRRNRRPQPQTRRPPAPSPSNT